MGIAMPVDARRPVVYGRNGSCGPPWRSETKVSPLLFRSARAPRHTSAEGSEILLNKIETVIQQNRALLRPLSSCGFYAPQPPAIPIAPYTRR
jgi:hypothetical protein